jgi:hypothetical protein
MASRCCRIAHYISLPLLNYTHTRVYSCYWHKINYFQHHLHKHNIASYTKSSFIRGNDFIQHGAQYRHDKPRPKLRWFVSRVVIAPLYLPSKLNLCFRMCDTSIELVFHQSRTYSIAHDYNMRTIVANDLFSNRFFWRSVAFDKHLLRTPKWIPFLHFVLKHAVKWLHWYIFISKEVISLHVCYLHCILGDLYVPWHIPTW